MKKWQEKIKQNQTTLLIILLTILTASLVLIALAPKNEVPIPPQLIKKPIVSPADALLSFSDSTPPGSTTRTVDVKVSSGTNRITGVQLEIAFDPKTISGVTITAGSFIDNPVKLNEKIDSMNGRISYVLGISPTGKPFQGVGTVAKISYTPTILQGQITFRFLPRTVVSSLGFPQSALKKTTDYTYTVGQVTPSQ